MDGFGGFLVCRPFSDRPTIDQSFSFLSTKPSGLWAFDVSYVYLWTFFSHQQHLTTTELVHWSANVHVAA